jgi:putrescine transport system substrate-binding protein
MLNRMLTATTVLAGMLAAGGAFAQQKVLNIYNWSDYIAEEVIEAFTKETGIKVVYDTFDSNEVLETKLLAGGSGYDVVVPGGVYMYRQIQAGVYQPLNKAKLPNLKNMWPLVMERNQKYDPGNVYSINYMWGTTGIGYNIAEIQKRLGIDEITSWDVVFKPENIAKLAGCGVHILDAPDEMFAAALHWLGKDPNTQNVDDFRAATDALLKIRPSIQKIHSSEYINALANGEICLAVGWSGDIFQAQARAEEAGAGVEIAYVIPQEGAQMWFDNMAIPKDAPNPEAAHLFLDFIMRPEMIAASSNYVYYANGNEASKPLLNEDVIGDPAIYPPDELMAKLYVLAPYSQSLQRQVTRLWTQVRTGS